MAEAPIMSFSMMVLALTFIMIIVSDSIYTLYPTGADSIMLMGCYELGVMTLAGAELFR